MPMSNLFKGRLFSRLPEIIERFGTPFHIYDITGILETGERMKAAFKGQLNEFFAVKALPNPQILKILFERLGFGFDCSSIPELVMSRGVGAKPADIMFTSNNTSDEEFRVAKQHGGCRLNLDDISLIDAVPDPFPDEICFRINPGNRIIRETVIGNPIKAKYGITLDQVVPAYRRAVERGATKFNIHTMLASNSLRELDVVETVDMLLEQMLILKKALGIQVGALNPGGGWGIPYRPDQVELKLEWMASEILSRLDNFECEHGWRPVFMSECGRYVTGPHGVLVARVINEKRIYKRYLGIDACMTALMRPAIYSTAYHGQIILGSDGVLLGGETEPISVVGPICEDCDRMCTDRDLPKSAKKGDISITEDTGAHGIAMGFNYNGRFRPQELMYLPNGEIVRIRQAETIENLFSTLILPEGFIYPDQE